MSDFFSSLLVDKGDGEATDIFADAPAQTVSVGVGSFIMCIVAALIIGLLISTVYMFTHKKEGYSQSYVMTMIMLPPVIAIMLLLINNTAGALTIAGTFTLVRFRSVAGDPRDMAYIFFSMAVGVACGLGYIGFALVFFAIMAIAMIILKTVSFGAAKSSHMTLKIAIPENLDYQGVFEPVLDKYTTFHKLRRVKTTNFGTLFELIYSVDVNDNIDQKKFIDELRTLNGNMTINLVFFRYDDKIYEQK